MLGDHGVGLRIEDKRHQGAELDVTFHGELTPVQEAAARALLQHDTGVVVAPPASARRCWAPTSWLRAGGARSSSSIASRFSTSGLPSSRCSWASSTKDIGQIGGGQDEAQRPARRRDGAEPRSQGRVSMTSSPATARSSSTSATTSPRSRSSACYRGQGQVHRRPDRDAAAPRWAPPDSRDAARARCGSPSTRRARPPSGRSTTG